MHRSVPANPPLVNAARQARVNCETRAALNTPPECPPDAVPLWRRVAVWPAAALIRLWWLTLRVDIPEEDLRVVTLQGEPTIFILWHNRLFMAAWMIRTYRGGHPLFSLISASSDGAWLTALFSSLGVRAVRGSSSRLGREAVNDLMEVLRLGFDVGITPDGPRGPMYELKPGALVVARRGRTRVVLIGADYESSWRLESWDGFHIPRPFSRVHLRYVEAGLDEARDRDEAARDLGRRLSEVNPDRAPAPVRRRA
jgi:lysophospholipid acyltransferase (LPLAT)-like uncharacterized protein